MKLTSFFIAATMALYSATFQVHAVDALVSSVSKAPIVPDGNVVAAATDIVIDLDTTLDPAVSGRTLLAGRTIKVTLPDEFVDTGMLPLQDVFSTTTCVPGDLQCSTAVLLQGWPQRPILPAVPTSPAGSGTPQYTLSLDGTNTIVFTANVDIVPGIELSGPGIKQIHLILRGYTNPIRPGFYPIIVEAETGPNGELESGTGTVQILPQIRPSINVTSAFNAGSPNTIYQTTAPGMLTPLAYDFLLWDRSGNPLENATVEMVNEDYALLYQGKKVVGNISITTPQGATGHEIFSMEPSSEVNAPISSVPTARLTLYFRAGSVSGEYVVTLAMNGGNEVKMYVQAE